MKKGLKAKNEQIAVGELASHPNSINSKRLLDDVRSLVEKSRSSLARAVNTGAGHALLACRELAAVGS